MSTFFITYHGGDVPIVDDRPIFIGRSSDLDLVDIGDTVSDPHARITVES